LKSFRDFAPNRAWSIGASVLLVGAGTFALTAKGELPAWIRNIEAKTDVERSFFRAMQLPYGEVLFRRPPAETRPALGDLIQQQPANADLYSLRALEDEPSATRTVLDASTRDVVVAYPDETLSEASAKMLSRNVGRLPVVDRADPRKIVGYLGRQAIMAGRLRRFEEEHVRERGWIGGRWRGGKGDQSLRPA